MVMFVVRVSVFWLGSVGNENTRVPHVDFSARLSV
jgi:hypothetical protein